MNTLNDDIQDIRGFVRQCTSLTEVTIPLSNITMYTDALTDCIKLSNIIWKGDLKNNMIMYGATSTALMSNQSEVCSYTQQDIQELVPEHLADLRKDKIKISFNNKTITINDTNTTWE